MTSGDCYYLQYTLAANHCQAFRLYNKEKEFIWNKVVKIETLPEEQVYDIEVEGTHNFIGNDIVAHNTYLTGGLGAGVAETTNGNITGTGRLAMTSTTATSTFPLEVWLLGQISLLFSRIAATPASGRRDQLPNFK